MKLLFICTHNRCRSILSEAIANQMGLNIDARSAGSQPCGEVHPLSLKYLEEAGFTTGGLRSKSWDEFAGFHPDLVITLCDSAAGESCPLWMGNAVKFHWGLEDPSRIQGNEEDVARAFHYCIDLIKTRTATLSRLIAQGLSPAEIRDQLQT